MALLEIIASITAEAAEACREESAEREALLQIYNRGGFMRGYAFGCEDAGVIDPAEPKHTGTDIGRVESAEGRLARIRVTRDLHDGDELEIRGKRSAG